MYPQVRLAEERCEEAESRVRQLEQQVIHLGSCQPINVLLCNVYFFIDLVYKHPCDVHVATENVINGYGTGFINDYSFLSKEIDLENDSFAAFLYLYMTE